MFYKPRIFMMLYEPRSQTILPVSWETCVWVKKEQLKPCMEQLIGLRVRKECDRAVCCHSVWPIRRAHHEKCQLDELQVWIKIGRRNINSLRYADAITLMAESKEELKSLWMRVREESERVGLKLNIQNTKVMPSSPITAWPIEGEKVEVVTHFLFLGSKITADSDCSHEFRR